jgi:Ca2+:H+ antiporter
MQKSSENSYATFQKSTSMEQRAEGTEIEPEQPAFDFIQDSKTILVSGPLNIFLVLIPPTVYLYVYTEYDLATFILSLLALSALAERLGYVTEQLALYTNETIGGLLNATFGNATEMIISLSALFKGLYRLIQLSLLGSVLSNMLLVLGTAFLFGGLRYERLYYHKITSQINSTLLMISTMAMIFPTVLLATQEQSPAQELLLSRVCSAILFVCYMALLYFQVS